MPGSESTGKRPSESLQRSTTTVKNMSTGGKKE